MADRRDSGRKAEGKSALRSLGRREHVTERFDGDPVELIALIRAEGSTGRLIVDFNQGHVLMMEFAQRNKVKGQGDDEKT